MKTIYLPTKPGDRNPAVDQMAACPVHALRLKLRAAGLRPTRQRVALGWLVLARGPRHLTAEGLYEEAIKARVPLSLATVYNTLRQFKSVGLLREIAVDGAKAHFDTNTSHHHHFLVDGHLSDITGDLAVTGVPTPPEGMEIDRIDIIVRLKPKKSSG